MNIIYTFCTSAGCGDLGGSYAGVVRGADGNFYGVTPQGGNSNPSLCSQSFGTGECGTAYRVTPEGAFSVIYDFCSQANCADGAVPFGQLISGIDGNLYGTTAQGGASGQGTVFKLTLGGKLSVLYSFNVSPCGNGQGWCAPLVQANNGKLYGTTTFGGTNGAGSFFELTLAGAFTTLYSFCSQANCADGYNPAGFVQGSDGNFYGATFSFYSGGGCGTAFRITAAGALTTLHSFNGSDGCNPSGLVQHTNGTFYGETFLGGTNNQGTLFSLSVGLGSFVETLPSAGKVGARVEILGSDLTGATSVTFNAVSANFRVVSATEITATVPTGATTGKVEVVIPAGTLKSNTKFHVRP